MRHHTDHDEKHAAINRLQKRIRKDWAKLYSLAALVIVPLLAVLAGEAASRLDASNQPGEFGWLLDELSTKSLLLMAVIWIVPLALIIQRKWHEIDAQKVLLTELQQTET